MDYKEFMSYGPKWVTVVDNKKDYQKAKEQVAKELGKKVEDLTEEEKDKALRKMGLCPLDFLD